LLLDDFDLSFERMSFSEATALRPFRDYAALVMAIGQPLHLANKEAAGSPLFQSTPLRHLEGLSPEEARRLLEEPAKKEGKPFATDDVEFILSYTSGHPYLIILAGRALWDMRKRLYILDTATPLQADERTLLLGHLAKDFGPSFELYWRRLDPKEREILKIFSQTKKPLENLEKSQYKFLSNLLELGLVKYVPHSGYETFSALFADFIETVDDTEAGSNLTGFETRLLDYLRRNANRVCTYEELWQNVWNQSLGDLDREQIRRRMQVTVSRLRQKLQPGEDIISIRDQGYKLI
jgi:Transcriptional regulatory protein, C terminal